MEQVVVIDNGTLFSKAGLSDKEGPDAVFRTIVGRPKFPGILVVANEKDCYVGKEAMEKRGVLSFKLPVDRGLVTNWDDMEKVWHHTFYSELKVSPEEHPVLLTEMPLNPKASREKMTQIMFETFGVKALYIEKIPVLSTYAAGRTTAVVVESGARETYSIGVHEGYIVPHSLMRLGLGGTDLTDYLIKLLNEKEYNFTTFAERLMVMDMKEKLCFVAEDFDAEMELFSKTTEHDKQYELPDGVLVTVGSQRFRCPEILFNPKLIGSESPPINDLVLQTIYKCDLDIRGELVENIILAGGNTMFEGLAERLRRELQGQFMVRNVRIVALPERKYASWIGGVKMVKDPSFKTLSLSKEEFDKNGPAIANKCG